MTDRKEELQDTIFEKPEHPAQEEPNNTRSKHDHDNNMNRNEIRERVGKQSYQNADNEGKEN